MGVLPPEILRLLGPGLKSSEFQFAAGLSLAMLWLCFRHENPDGTVGASEALKMASVICSSILAVVYLIARPTSKLKAIPHLLSSPSDEPRALPPAPAPKPSFDRRGQEIDQQRFP